MSRELTVQTSGRGFYRIDEHICDLVHGASFRDGLINLFIQHTSASLLVTENADPDVLVDLERWMSDLVVDGDPRFRHRAEGPDDMAAHIRSALTLTSLNVPIANGRLSLGTWQGIFLWEHRARPHHRRITITMVPASP